MMTEEEVLRMNMKLEQPILHYRKDENNQLPRLPEKGMYFVLARNGLFVHKDNHIGRALVQIQQFKVAGWDKGQTINGSIHIEMSL